MSGTLTSSTTGDQLRYETRAKWTIERKFRDVSAPASTVPYSILLLDRQYYLKAHACFVRHVRQINHREAATNLSKINIPFASQREGLTIHWIRIWRGGEALEQISSADALGVSASSIPNRVAAQFVLSDLRPGDALDVAYTIKASSGTPGFSAIQPLHQRLPVLDWHLSAIVPADAQLRSRLPADLGEAEVKTLSEGSSFHHWHLGDVPPKPPLANLPSWCQADSEIQLSTRASWAEVANEIHQQWQIEAGGPAVAAVAQSFPATTPPDIWESARHACRFVQDQISNLPMRDLAVAAVDPPAQVLERHEGDAKAKACLLVSLLRALGVPSAPVLVSRTRTRSLADALPSPDLFDHVIVRGQIDGSDFWIDPSACHEAGPIRAMVLPTYGCGLQVSARTSQLSTIPLPSPKENLLTVTEHFIVRDTHQASVAISVRGLGCEANRLRARLAELGQQGLADARLAEFERRYPGSSRAGTLEIEDDAAINQIHLTEKFDLSDLSRGGKSSASFTPAEIRRHLPKLPTSSAPDDHPIALEFPCNIRQLIVIDTPWSAATREPVEHLPGAGFSFTFKGEAQARRHTLRFAYGSDTDHLLPAEFASARQRLEKIRSHLDYHIELPLPAKPIENKVISSKGPRLVKKVEGVENAASNKLGERKNAPNSSIHLIRPLIATAAVIALVLIVKASFKERAQETSAAIKEKKLATLAAQPKPEPEPEAKKIVELPDDPLDLFPKIQPLPGPDKLDDLEFGIDTGAGTSEEKASDKKNATSGDWKVGN